MLKKKEEIISFEQILKDDFYRTAINSDRQRIVEEARSFNSTILSKFLFVTLKDTLVGLLTTSKTMEDINYYKSMIATLETLKTKIDLISQNSI